MPDERPVDPDSDLSNTSPDGAEVQAVLRRIREQRRSETNRAVPRVLRELTKPAEEAEKYDIQEKIGAGGVGVVYQGRDSHLGREVALKFLNDRFRDDPSIIARFLEEAQISGQLEHPGIVPVHDIGIMNDQLFFAMKRIRGRALSDILAEREDVVQERQRFFSIFEAICQTVAYAHDRNVIHRDLKPANVMVGTFGEVQVVDWGMAKVLGANEKTVERERQGGLAVIPVDTVRSEGQTGSAPSIEGAVLGTPEYMPPEQARGDIDRLDARSDVFALGAVLLEILTGEPPYGSRGRTRLDAARNAILDDARSRLDRCTADPEITQLCWQCLQPEQDQRPDNAVAVARRIRDYLESVERRAQEAQITAAQAQIKAEAERRARRLTMALTSSILLILSIVGVGWSILDHQAQERQRTTDSAILDNLRTAHTSRAKGNWTQAVAAAKSATALVRTGTASQPVADRVETESREILSAAHAAENTIALNRENDALLHTLAETRQPEADPTYPKNWAPIANAYEASFQAKGHDILHGDLEAVLAKLTQRGRTEEFAAYLDSWSAACKRAGRDDYANRLLLIAGRLDADPARQSFREALQKGDTQALKQFAEREDLLSNPPTTLHLLGQALHSRGAAKSARSVYRRGVERYRRDFPLVVGLARSYYNSLPQRPRLAARYLTAALALRPGSNEVRHELGRVLSQRLEEYSAALGHFRAILAVHPSDGHIWWHIGLVYDGLNEPEKAEEAYRKSIALGKEPLAMSSLGNNLWKQGKFVAAEGSLRKFLQTRPENPWAWSHLGMVLEEQAKPEAALAAHRESLKHAPNDGSFRSKTHVNIGLLLYHAKKKDLSFAEFKLAAKADPENGRAWAEIGMFHFVRRNDREARAALEKAVKYEPDQSLPWTNLGLLMRDHQEFAGAIRTIRRGLENGRDRKSWRDYATKSLARTYQLWGDHLNRFGNSKDAIEKYEKSLEFGPRNRNALFELAVCLSAQKQTEEAIKTYREVVDVDPTLAEAWCNLGLLLRKKAQLTGALEALEKGHALGSKRPQWKYPSSKWISETRAMLKKRK